MQGEGEVDVEGEAQGHDMRVEFGELQGRCMLWQGVKIHLKEVYCERTVDIVEFIFVFAIRPFQVFLIDLVEVMEIVRAFHVNALVDDEVLTILLVGQRITAVGAAQGIVFGKAV